jgi:alpha/beta superfamily hydrolase
MLSAVKTISGPAGLLEIRIKENSDQARGLVVLSHPHPLYGGTMNNKVITTLEKAFYGLGYHTVAFNFRGVGKSEGEYDNGIGEQQDLVEVLRWAKQGLNPSQVVLAGFSFGSYVTLMVLNQLSDVDGLCTVAPPVGLYDFSQIQAVEQPWVLIQGGKDEVISAQEVMDWAMSRSPRPDFFWRSKASHFFHGELVWLRKIVAANF